MLLHRDPSRVDVDRRTVHVNLLENPPVRSKETWWVQIRPVKSGLEKFRAALNSVTREISQKTKNAFKCSFEIAFCTAFWRPLEMKGQGR